MTLSTAPKILKKRKAISRVKQLGSKVDLLRNAVQRGHAAMAFTTANDAPAGPGFIRWNAIVRAVRELHAPLGGWKRDQRNGRGLCVNEELGIEIEPQTGNADTGTDRTPRTHRPKGPTVCEQVSHQTQGRFAFFDQPLASDLVVPEPTEAELWILLFYYDQVIGEIRVELSHAKSVDEKGRICDWYERIILDPVSVDDEPELSADDTDDDAITIDIVARSR